MAAETFERAVLEQLNPSTRQQGRKVTPPSGVRQSQSPSSAAIEPQKMVRLTVERVTYEPSSGEVIIHRRDRKDKSYA